MLDYNICILSELFNMYFLLCARLYIDKYILIYKYFSIIHYYYNK